MITLVLAWVGVFFTGVLRGLVRRRSLRVHVWWLSDVLRCIWWWLWTPFLLCAAVTPVFDLSQLYIFSVRFNGWVVAGGLVNVDVHLSSSGVVGCFH